MEKKKGKTKVNQLLYLTLQSSVKGKTFIQQLKGDEINTTRVSAV